MVHHALRGHDDGHVGGSQLRPQLRGLVTVLAIGFAVRLLFATVLVPRLEERANIASDPDRYADLATSILDRGELGFSPPGATPTTVRGPAFPAWLALGMLAGRSPRWISLWSSIPGLIAAAAIFLVLDRTGGRRAAIVGGLLCAIHPLSCFVSARVLPDEFYGAVLLLGLLAVGGTSVLGTKPRDPIVSAAIAGVFLSVAALTRSTAALIMGALVIVLGVKERRVRAAATVALIGAVLLGAWTVRTSALAGRTVFVESLVGYNFWLGEAAHRYGFAANFGEARARAHELMAEQAGVDTRSPSFYYGTLGPREADRFDEQLSDAAVKLVTAAPFNYLKRCAGGMFWFWVRAETKARTVQYSLVALPLVGLGLLGLYKTGSRWFTFVVLAHLIIYAALCPMARYSVQLYPLLCYLAGRVFVPRDLLDE